MHKFRWTSAMIREHNEHQLNVDVINVKEKNPIILQAQQKEDNDAKY